MNDRKNYNYSCRWTQPYPNWRPQLSSRQAAETLTLLLAYHEIDCLVDSRLTYLEAESIIKHIATNSKRDPNV